MSPINPCGPSGPPFNLSELAEFTQPPTAGGLINALFYARQKYGTRSPAGYTRNLDDVIALLKNLQQQERDPQTKDSIVGAIEHLEYLNGTVFPQIPAIVGQLLSQMFNTTLD